MIHSRVAGPGLRSGLARVVFLLLLGSACVVHASCAPGPSLDSMEEELQQLREQLSQLKADNERLLRDRASPQAGASGVNQTPGTPTGSVPSGTSTVSMERVFVMPRPGLRSGLARVVFLLLLGSACVVHASCAPGPSLGKANFQLEHLHLQRSWCSEE
uniref:Uncharacterized protein n=1 Tax=Knipowitschia caucasica TaxID=637954 RepID=A0AAV2LGK7_KNICA